MSWTILNLQAMRNYILWAGVIFTLLTSCRQFKEPDFKSIQNVVLNKPGLEKSLMTFDMEYFNPNDTWARLKEAEGDAWLDSIYLGHFRVDTIVEIPANSNFIIPVKLDVDMKNMLTHSMAAFLKESVLVTIKGKAKVGKSGFFKKFPLNYEGRKDVREFFKR